MLSMRKLSPPCNPLQPCCIWIFFCIRIHCLGQWQTAGLSQEVREVHFSQTHFFMVLEFLTVHTPFYFTLFFQRHLIQQTQQGLNCQILRTGHSSSPLLGIFKPTSIPLRLVSSPLLFVLKLVPGHFTYTIFLSLTQQTHYYSNYFFKIISL